MKFRHKDIRKDRKTGRQKDRKTEDRKTERCKREKRISWQIENLDR